MSQDLVLKDVRFTWLDVLEENKKYGNYRVECLLEPDSTEDKNLQSAIREAAVEKWGEAKANNFIKSAAANRKVCRKTEMLPNKKTGEVADFYVGKVVLTASRRADRDGPPRVYCARLDDPTKLKPVSKDSTFDGLVKPVGGNFGDVIVNIWAFEFDGAPQINCTLDTVAFRREGEPISTRTKLSEAGVAAALGAAIETDDPFNE